MGKISCAGISSIVFGSISLCFTCCALIYIIYALAIIGAFLGGYGAAASGIIGLATIPYIFLLVTGALGVAAGAKTIKKGVWIAAVVFSVITLLGYIVITILGVVYGSFQTFYAGLGIAITDLICVGLLVSTSVGLAQVEKQKEIRRQQASSQHQLPVAVFVNQPQPNGLPQYQQNPQGPPQYQPKPQGPPPFTQHEKGFTNQQNYY